MITKFIQQLKTLSMATLIAGLILLGIGCYYVLIKAGIPYQDPPLKLQIEYAVNMRTGMVLIRCGLITGAAGGIFRLLLWKLLRRP